jgi:hypothetical protein
MISWDCPFIYNDSVFRLSLLVYVADKYANDQMQMTKYTYTTVLPLSLSFSIPR